MSFVLSREAFYLSNYLRQTPQAVARIIGSKKYSSIYGRVLFYQTQYGVLVCSDIDGLPTSTERCRYGVFGFHIHEGEECSGNLNDEFADAKMHYNPQKCPHPFHAGDMPPLFENDGYAYSIFLTDRFKLKSVIGKTVIIHSMPDDFATQPSGNAGEKIACGIIKN